jgi:hypothetical protein
MAKVRAEVSAAGAKYAEDKSAPLVDQLSQIPIEGWETSFPTIDLCFKESMRLQLIGTIYRKNTSGCSRKSYSHTRLLVSSEARSCFTSLEDLLLAFETAPMLLSSGQNFHV